MSTNVKLNPCYLIQSWNKDGLDYIIANDPGTTNIQEYSSVVSNYLLSIMHNSAFLATSDRISIVQKISGVLNFLSADSWCTDCCNNTFDSYKIIKAKIEDMDLSIAQMAYLNQIVGLPCNYSILEEHCIAILKQLETTVLIDKQMSEYEKLPVLSTISVAIETLVYWQEEANIPGPWAVYMTPGAPEDFVRPFWLMSILGALMGSTEFRMSPAQDYNESLLIGALCGSLTASTFYAVFK